MRQRDELPVYDLSNEVNPTIAWGEYPLTEFHFVVDPAVTSRILGLGLSVAVYQRRSDDGRGELPLAANARGGRLPGKCEHQKGS